MPRISWTLFAGDCAAFLLFGMIGLASHEEALSGEIIGRSLLPFPIAWLAIAPWFGLLRDDWAGTRGSWARLVISWLVAGTVALIARSLIFDRELLNAFFVIALVGNGLFLAVWRAIYIRWRASRRAAENRPPFGIPEHEVSDG